MTKHRILFLAANPAGTTQIKLDEEARTIGEELRRATHRDRFELVTRWAVQPLDLLRALREVKPAIVHFAGHADADGIYLTNRLGQRVLVTNEALRDTFKAAGGAVQVVVLNACSTQALATALCEHVPICVGTSAAILDEDALAFSIGFYGAITEGEPVRRAFEQARAAIKLERGGTVDVSHLDHRREVDPGAFVLTDQPVPGSYSLIEGERTARNIPAAETGRARLPAPATTDPDEKGRRVISVIGIDRYERWPILVNAVNDARSVRGQFLNHGFDELAPPLLNEGATRAAMSRLVTDDLAGLGVNDSLVLFFAGHSHAGVHRFAAGNDVTTGYLVPVDAASVNGGMSSSCVRLESWLSDVARLPAKHILVILDGGHRGIALGDNVARVRGAPRTEDLSRLRLRRSRRIITSATGDEIAIDNGPAAGHSLFTGCLLEGLSSGLRQGGTQLATGSDVAVYVQWHVMDYSGRRQCPEIGTFDHDDRGELVIPLVRPAT